MKFERLLIGYRRLRARLWWEQHWRDANFQPPWLRQAPQPFVLTGFEAGWLSPGMNALDIGCGAGHTAAWLAARGINVVAVDFARHMIAQAKSRFGDQPALTFKVMDVCGPDLLNITFDVLIDAGCLHTIASALRRQYLQNVLRWSRRGSRLVVTMHSRRKSTQERLAELEALFCPAFELVQYEEIPSFEANRVNPVFHLIRT